MALFSRSKKEEATAVKTESNAAAPKKPVAVNTAKATDRDLKSVLIAPRVTEKAVGKSEQNVYTFLIRPDATKFDVRDAVKQQWGVTPKKVNIVNKAPRTVVSRMRGRTSKQPGQKKAYVYLAAGDSIELA